MKPVLLPTAAPTPTKPLPCLTEISTGALTASAVAVSALLWLAIGAVI